MVTRTTWNAVTSSLAKAELEPLMIIILLIVGAICCAVMYVQTREFLYPRAFTGRFKRFFGKSLREVQTHDKTFPGYDLASVHRALTRFFAEDCVWHEILGSCPGPELRDLLDSSPENHFAKLKPGSPSFTRVPVDLDEEESLLDNCIYLARLKPPHGTPADDASTEKVILMLRSVVSRVDYAEDMEAHASPTAAVAVTIACRGRHIADRFFNDLEARRQRLSVYRGKVIDPVVTVGGVKTIAFKRIQAVAEQDLILPASVTHLLHTSIVGFYRHEETLRSLGVEMKRGILFHSPPGTGKTSISLYLAGLLPNFTVCFVSGRRLLFPREICSMARYLQPTMLVFEDIDLIAQERDSNGLATVLGELMNQIDGCEPNDRVLFIMNTNSMDRIEQAVRNRPGRVDQIIHIPLPNVELRERLLLRFTRNLHVTLEDLRIAAEGTEGATPALLKEIVKRAAVRGIERHSPASPSSPNGNGTPLSITGNDLLMAFEQVQQLRPNRPASAEVL